MFKVLATTIENPEETLTVAEGFPTRGEAVAFAQAQNKVIPGVHFYAAKETTDKAEG